MPDALNEKHVEGVGGRGCSQAYPTLPTGGRVTFCIDVWWEWATTTWQQGATTVVVYLIFMITSQQSVKKSCSQNSLEIFQHWKQSIDLKTGQAWWASWASFTHCPVTRIHSLLPVYYHIINSGITENHGSHKGLSWAGVLPSHGLHSTNDWNVTTWYELHSHNTSHMYRL